MKNFPDEVVLNRLLEKFLSEKHAMKVIANELHTAKPICEFPTNIIDLFIGSALPLNDETVSLFDRYLDYDEPEQKMDNIYERIKNTGYKAEEISKLCSSCSKLFDAVPELEAEIDDDFFPIYSYEAVSALMPFQEISEANDPNFSEHRSQLYEIMSSEGALADKNSTSNFMRNISDSFVAYPTALKNLFWSGKLPFESEVFKALNSAGGNAVESSKFWAAESNFKTLSDNVYANMPAPSAKIYNIISNIALAANVNQTLEQVMEDPTMLVDDNPAVRKTTPEKPKTSNAFFDNEFFDDDDFSDEDELDKEFPPDPDQKRLNIPVKEESTEDDFETDDDYFNDEDDELIDPDALINKKDSGIHRASEMMWKYRAEKGTAEADDREKRRRNIKNAYVRIPKMNCTGEYLTRGMDAVCKTCGNYSNGSVNSCRYCKFYFLLTWLAENQPE